LAAEDAAARPLSFGSSHVPDPVAAVAGWSAFELGDTLQAEQLLRPALQRIPIQARRARARFGARLALTLASSRQLDEACAVTEEVLSAYTEAPSATIATDLRRLARTLRRWPTDAVANQLGIRLVEVLQQPLAAPTGAVAGHRSPMVITG
jgi:hypothetical protein